MDQITSFIRPAGVWQRRGVTAQLNPLIVNFERDDVLSRVATTMFGDEQGARDLLSLLDSTEQNDRVGAGGQVAVGQRLSYQGFEHRLLRSQQYHCGCLRMVVGMTLHMLLVG